MIRNKLANYRGKLVARWDAALHLELYEHGMASLPSTPEVQASIDEAKTYAPDGGVVRGLAHAALVLTKGDLLAIPGQRHREEQRALLAGKVGRIFKDAIGTIDWQIAPNGDMSRPDQYDSRLKEWSKANTTIPNGAEIESTVSYVPDKGAMTIKTVNGPEYSLTFRDDNLVHGHTLPFTGDNNPVVRVRHEDGDWRSVSALPASLAIPHLGAVSSAIGETIWGLGTSPFRPKPE